MSTRAGVDAFLSSAGRDTECRERHVQSIPEEEAHYEELTRAHYAHVIRLCRLLLGDFHEAEDVMQEVLLKLWRECHVPHQSMAWGP